VVLLFRIFWYSGTLSPSVLYGGVHGIMPPTLQLVDKYQPRHIQDFVGLKDIKQILTAFVAHPCASNWLFSGAPA